MNKRTPKLSILLKSFREANGYTQDDICEILEIEKSTLSRWENGLAKPTGRDTIEKIKKLYSISAEEMQVLFIDWNASESEPDLKSDYQILGYQSLGLLGLSEEELIEKLIPLDLTTTSWMEFEQEGSVEQWTKIIKASPFTWKVLVFGQEIVGYWFYVCVNDKTFEKAKKGEIKEAEIDVVDIEVPYYLDKDKLYKMYILAFVIERRHQDPIIGGRFVQSFFDDVRRFAEGGIFFSDACTVAHTLEDLTICKLLNFRAVGRLLEAPDGQIADIFHITGEDLANQTIKVDPKLSRLYQRRFMGA
jgi:transcriptional regulator with XRE-family HTH domain